MIVDDGSCFLLLVSCRLLTRRFRKKYFDVLVLIRVVRRSKKVLVDAQCVRPNKNKRPVMFFPKKSVPRVSTIYKKSTVRSVPNYCGVTVRPLGHTKFKVRSGN